jgi:mannose-6-phosphate isomerase
MGAHPLAPSRIASRRATTLAELIASSPERTLGTRSLTAHGRTLPFLLKVLAADQPLSLQAHPDLAQARAGFAREEAARIPRDAPNRSYKDPNHKPELICALTEFDALCGFRPAQESIELLDALSVRDLAPFRDALARAFRGRAARDVHVALHARSRSPQGARHRRRRRGIESCRARAVRTRVRVDATVRRTLSR